MADPITTSIQIGISAVKAGASIASWWELRQRNKREEGRGTSSSTSGASLDEIFLVFSSLGQRLMALDVVNYDALPQALAAVKVAMDTSEDDLTYELERMDPILQYLIASAFIFCAACHPMPIYYGYGCGVMNNVTWANPENPTFWNLDIDQAIAYLKSVPHPFQLLKKSPSSIGKSEPYYEKYDKKALKAEVAVATDMFKQCEKYGYAQPLPPNNNITIGTWGIPFATYGGSIMYGNYGHDFSALFTWQVDPGRFLYAWTIGERADLRAGEAILLLDEHIGALACWLEGLNGITFKVLYDSDLDWSKLKLKSSTKKYNMANYGNEYGIRNVPDVIVRHPDPTMLLAARLDTLHMVSMSLPVAKAKEPVANPQNASSPATSSPEISSPQSPSVLTSPPTSPPPTTSPRSMTDPAVADTINVRTADQMPRVEPVASSTPVSPLNPTSPLTTMSAPLDTLSTLPPGWEARLTPDKRMYYVNHNTQTTTWTRPAPLEQSPLPPGWEQLWAPDGRPYYVDHNNQSTSWDRPSPVEVLPPLYQTAVVRKPVSFSTSSTASSIPLSETQSFETIQSDTTVGAASPGQGASKVEDQTRLPPQEHRELRNTRLYSGQKKSLCWTADVPVTPSLYQKLPSGQFELSYIRHTALTGQVSDLRNLDYIMRRTGRAELVVWLNLHDESSFEREILNNQLTTTLGSILEEVRTHSFSRDFGDRCNGQPQTGIVVCILIHQDRMKEIPWLQQMGISFPWDISSSVPISDAKRATSQFYDDAHKATRKIMGKEVKVTLNEVGNTNLTSYCLCSC